jgi:hypothetical protein
VLRVLAFIRRLPGVSRDAFRSHYEEVHVATALPLLGPLAAYERQHVREELLGAPAFDCVTRFDYRDAAAAGAAFARTEGPEGEGIRRDERLFMDKPANVVLPVETSTLWESGDPSAARVRLLVCARRPAGEVPARFRARFEEEALPDLRGRLSAARWCRSHWSLAPEPPPGGFDVVNELAAEDSAGLVEWARVLEAEGAQLVAVRVSVHATRLAA